MSSTIDHQTWLPRTALNDGRLLDWLSEVIQAWGEAWMGSTRANQLSVVENISDFSHFESSHFLQEGPALSIRTTDRNDLAEYLLGSSIEGMSVNTTDQSMVRELLEEAIGDVLVQLSRHESEVRKGQADANWICQFSVYYENSVLFQIAVPRHLAIEWRRSLVPELPIKPIEFGEIRTAIATKVIKLDAEVGRLSFDIDKMSSLKVGDVIEIDRAVDEGFPLRADGKKCDGIQARFVITQMKKRARRQPNIILEHSNE